MIESAFFLFLDIMPEKFCGEYKGVDESFDEILNFGE